MAFIPPEFGITPPAGNTHPNNDGRIELRLGNVVESLLTELDHHPELDPYWFDVLLVKLPYDQKKHVPLLDDSVGKSILKITKGAKAQYLFHHIFQQKLKKGDYRLSIIVNGVLKIDRTLSVAPSLR